MRIADMNREQLWDLRSEVCLCSLYTADFENGYEVEEHDCQDFFDGYADYLGELMEDDGIGDERYFERLDEYDTEENLWYWHSMIEWEV